MRAYWQRPEPADRGRPCAQALTLEAIRWQYLHGVPDQSLVSPDTWDHDFALVSRPGNDLVQLALFADYASNLPLYPKLHAYLRDSGVPLLAVWGRNDEIFRPEGALAFAEDAPDAEIHLLDGGHFLLESHLDAAAGHIRGFLEGRCHDRTAARTRPCWSSGGAAGSPARSPSPPGTPERTSSPPAATRTPSPPPTPASPASPPRPST